MKRAVLLHGFLGSPADWADVLAHLVPGIQCECVALRDLGCASIACAAQQLALRLESEPCDALIGYSMGGRIALELAATRPELAPQLLLLSTSAGVSEQAEREVRAREDDARAAQLRELGIDAFAQQWYELPLFAPFRAHSSFMHARARRALGDADFWSECIAACSPGRSVCREDALIQRASRSTLAVGALDERYALSARRLACLATTLTIETIPHAGHVLPLEAPSACARLIERATESSS